MPAIARSAISTSIGFPASPPADAHERVQRDGGRGVGAEPVERLGGVDDDAPRASARAPSSVDAVRVKLPLQPQVLALDALPQLVLELLEPLRQRATLHARICTARIAAFSAPALPTATVATGTPAGICTVASSASMPFRLRRRPAARRSPAASCTPRRRRPGARRPPAPAMSTPRPRSRGGCAYSAVRLRRAMRRHHAHLVRDAERIEALRRRLTSPPSRCRCPSECRPAGRPSRPAMSVLRSARQRTVADVAPVLHAVASGCARPRRTRSRTRRSDVVAERGDAEHAPAVGDDAVAASRVVPAWKTTPSRQSRSPSRPSIDRRLLERRPDSPRPPARRTRRRARPTRASRSARRPSTRALHQVDEIGRAGAASAPGTPDRRSAR